jgi:integrase
MAIKKLTSGHYQIDFRDRDGVRHRESFRLRKDAEAAMDERRDEVRKNEYIPPRSLPTFGEVADKWLESRTNRRPSTVAHWKNHIERYLKPDLGIFRLDMIDVKLVEDGRDKWAKIVSPKSVNKALTTGAAIFKAAIRQSNGRIKLNPFALAERAVPNSGEILEDGSTERDGVEVREGGVYSPEEIRRLIEAADDGLGKALLMAAAFTGARSGELLALQWPDFDLVAGKVMIRRSLSWVDGKPRFFAPKTKAGLRVIPIPPELVSQLKRWKLRCPLSDTELVFPTEAGSPAHRSNVLRGILYPAMSRAKLRRLGMHSLRHSYASILLAQGTPPTEVAGYLGHSSPAVTMTIYAHWLPKVETNSVNRMASAILSARPDRGHFLDTSEVANAG